MSEMEESRDEVLATFQFVTGIEDINEAIVLLESVDWNLQAALSSEGLERSQLRPEANEAILSTLPNPLSYESNSVVDGGDISDEYVPSEPGSDVSIDEQRKGPLIPENVEDELNGSLCFIENYTKNFGQNIPTFYAGTLEDATKEAFTQPASKKKMLGIYLHNANSIMSNIFCSQLLGFDGILKKLQDNFLIWGWDVSHPSNKTMYLQATEKFLGRSVRDATANLSTERYPVFLAVSRFRAMTYIQMVVHGDVGIEQFITRLGVSIDEFREQQELEVKEEEARAEREKLKSLQDKAFKESLEIDRAKAKTKRQKLILKHEQEEKLRKKEEEERLQREEEIQAAEALLPEEPEDSTSESVVTLKFRPPSGEVFQRKFLLSNTLELVFNFLLSRGYRLDEYRVVFGWPRNDLSSFDRHLLLADLGISPQETLIIALK